jgi:hypothetical protein
MTPEVFCFKKTYVYVGIFVLIFIFYRYVTLENQLAQTIALLPSSAQKTETSDNSEAIITKVLGDLLITAI